MNELSTAYRSLLQAGSHIIPQAYRKEIRKLIGQLFEIQPEYSIRQVVKNLQTTVIILNEIGLGRSTAIALLLYDAVKANLITVEQIEEQFTPSAAIIVRGLSRANELYERNAAIETENFRKLLLTFSEDVRVVFILIADRLHTMRNLPDYPVDEQQKIAREASYLYAPLSHRMGLYAIKTELEDLSLKYTSREIYTDIALKLAETKHTREQYIQEFIFPLKEKLTKAGFDFELKGRTKSIHSIWNKIKKQNTPFEHIYDLFAIRIILNTPPEKEKADCWQVYSIVTDMYQPNPKRLRDWLSMPKPNGYESLHITVMGPKGKWVEVQIRTVRMDEIAEKGYAAHWKYKGLRTEAIMEEWLKNIRGLLENPEVNNTDLINDFKLNLYSEEVFVFTPKGDLLKLPQDATVLDLAFDIHSNLGAKCAGAIVNGKNVPIRHRLANGDQVEILTSSTQQPKQDWLNFVTTSKARNKIKQSLKEAQNRDAENGKELLQRRLKNWKIEYDDGIISHLTKCLGYKTTVEFYQSIALERIDILKIRHELLEMQREGHSTELSQDRSAANYISETPLQELSAKEDVLVIDQNLKNVEYKLSKCCNPIYGDDIFGFVSVMGGIKIHRSDCPNAPQLIQRFGYRIVPAQWSGKSGATHYPITLRVLGNDDIGIVTNITSVISKENKITLRTISVDANDGLFQGAITVLVQDLAALETLIKKIRLIKGVKQVNRY